MNLAVCRFRFGRSPTELFADLEHARAGHTFTFFAYIPLSVWPLVESFAISSVLIVASSFVAQVISPQNSGDSKETVPEIERLLFSIQYSFADVITALIVDPRIHYVLALIGFVGLKPLTDLVNTGGTTIHYLIRAYPFHRKFLSNE